MDVMGHEWAYECPDCGRIGQHAKTCGMFPLGIVDAGNRVEVVRAADHQGAVGLVREALNEVRQIGCTPDAYGLTHEAEAKLMAALTALGGQ